MRWLDGITDVMDVRLGGSRSWWWAGGPGKLWSMGPQSLGGSRSWWWAGGPGVLWSVGPQSLGGSRSWWWAGGPGVLWSVGPQSLGGSRSWWWAGVLVCCSPWSLKESDTTELSTATQKLLTE